MLEKLAMNGREYLIYELSESNKVDDVGVKMIEHNNIEGILPFKFVREEDKDYFRYDMFSNEMLPSWLNRIRTKQEVIALLKSIICVFTEMEAFLLKQDNFCLDPNYICVDDGKAMFVYIPDLKYSSGRVLDLVKEILRMVRYPMDEDFGYIFDMQNAFSRGEIYDLADLKKWVRIVNGEYKEAADEVKDEQNAFHVEEKALVSQKAVSSENMQVQSMRDNKVENVLSEGKEELNNNKGDVVNDLFADFGITPTSSKKDKKKAEKVRTPKQDKEKKDIRSMFSKKGKEPEQDMVSYEPVYKEQNVETKQHQIYINDLNRGNSTVLVGITDERNKPTLIRDRNRQEYEILSNDCVIGSGKAAIICISDNNAISRQHARIFVTNDQYYIEDLGSTNGTIVDGQKLKPNAPCLISDMSHIKISNETFTFCIRN